MLEKIKSSLQQVGVVLADQAANLGGTAKEKGYQLIEDWVKSLSKFEDLGFEVTSFAIGVSISPSCEIELHAPHQTFPLERIDDILKTQKMGTPVNLVFSTIKTTYNLHQKAGCQLQEPLIVKIRVRISPEIKVFLGMPKLI